MRPSLAEPGVQYVVFQSKPGEAFSVDVKPGAYRYQWFNADQGVAAGEGRIESAGGRQEFKAPFAQNAVLELKADKPK